MSRKFPWLLPVAAIYMLYAFSKIGDFPDKLWLHRCNSLEKMKEKQDRFPNIEVDLIYRGYGKFDVTHDADTTFGLYLDRYFPIIARSGNHLWLDIKNIDFTNYKEMCSALDSLCRHYKVEKEQLIVEGSNWKAMGEFTQKGFYTSYYVPFDNPSELSEQEEENCIRALQHIADSKMVSAISFPAWWYDDISEELNRPIDLLTWKHRTPEWLFMLSPEHHKMLESPQLKVILIKSKGEYHR